jgi:glutathione S-transferase
VAEHTGLPLPPHCAAHQAWMRRMPVVQQVLAEEGYRR